MHPVLGFASILVMATTTHNSIHTGEAWRLAEHLAQGHGRQTAHLTPNEQNEVLHSRLTCSWTPR